MQMASACIYTTCALKRVGSLADVPIGGSPHAYWESRCLQPESSQYDHTTLAESAVRSTRSIVRAQSLFTRLILHGLEVRWPVMRYIDKHPGLS